MEDIKSPAESALIGRKKIFHKGFEPCPKINDVKSQVRSASALRLSGKMTTDGIINRDFLKGFNETVVLIRFEFGVHIAYITTANLQ